MKIICASCWLQQITFDSWSCNTLNKNVENTKTYKHYIIKKNNDYSETTTDTIVFIDGHNLKFNEIKVDGMKTILSCQISTWAASIVVLTKCIQKA